MSNKSINSVFYANSYHPIQAGSIDGTDILPHDNAVLRAHLCSSAALYDPYGDPNATGDPYCTLFVSRLSHLSTEHTLRRAMNKYGRVKNLRLVRHIVTGASCGYAFVEFETQREMRRAYKDAHHSIIDDSEVLVDYNRQQLMPGWIPRRLGGGLGGKKESGQLRFGGRERPFRAPLRLIPYDDLKKLGIPPPPEGKYMSRHQVPSPPRRDKSSEDTEGDFHKSKSVERYEISPVGEDDHRRKRKSMDREERGNHYNERTSIEKDGRSYSSTSRSEQYHKRKLVNDDVSYKDGYRRSEKHSDKRSKSHRSDSRSSESEDWR